MTKKILAIVACIAILVTCMCGCSDSTKSSAEMEMQKDLKDAIMFDLMINLESKYKYNDITNEFAGTDNEALNLKYDDMKFDTCVESNGEYSITGTWLARDVDSGEYYEGNFEAICIKVNDGYFECKSAEYGDAHKAKNASSYFTDDF